MWSAGSECAHVYVGQSIAGGLRRADGQSRSVRWSPTSSPLQGWEEAVDWLSQPLPAGAAVRRARVWLSGSLARPFMFGPVEGLRHEREAIDLAHSLAPEATGMAGPCLVWLDSWLPGGSCVAIAIERELRDAIESFAKKRHLRLASLRPWWAGVLDESVGSPDPCQMLAIEDTDSLTVISGRGKVDSIGTYLPPPPATERAAILARRSLSQVVPAEQVRYARLEVADEAPGDAESLQPTPFLRWDEGIT